MKKLEYLGRRNICGERVRKERVTRRISQERLVTDYELRTFAAVFQVPIESLLEPETL